MRCSRSLALAALLLATAARGLLAADQPVAAKPLERVRLQLKWFHQFQFAGYYMARKLGFYRDEGLEVDIAEAGPDTRLTEEVVSGRAEYGINTTDLLIERVHGMPVVVLGVIFQHSPTVVLSLKGSGIVSPKDLVGRTVMVSTSESEVYAMLENEAIPKEAIRLLPHSLDLGDLIGRRVDAMTAYSTSEPLRLRKLGVESAMIRPLTYGIDFYGDCLFTSQKELRDHPTRTAAFLRASLRGWEYAMDHVEETINVIMTDYSSRKDRADLELEAAAMDELVVHKFVPLGFMNPGRWAYIGTTYARLGLIPADFSLEGFLYSARTGSDLRLLWWGVAALVLVSGSALGYILILRAFNARLSLEVASRTERLESLNAELGREVAERSAKEGAFAASLAEKEVLLREIHHRVKNNLQVIASLVNLEISQISDPAMTVPLESIRNRVYSMALVHEHLYEGVNLSSIDMDDYLRTLVGQIVQSYGRPGLETRASSSAEGISFGIEQAIPIGLIAGELVSNCMKYAFAARSEGSIEVRLGVEGANYVLTVADDGEGGAIDESAPATGIGLQLVEALASQLGGAMSHMGGGGRTTRIAFPPPPSTA